MGDQINVSSFSEALSIVSRFQSVSEQLQDLIGTMDGIQQSLGAVWSGTAFQNFVNAYSECKPHLSRMVPIVAELKTEADRKLQNLQNANR